MIGGSCPNIASLLSKNLIHSGKVADFVRHVGQFGLRLGPWSVRMASVQQHKRAMVDAMIAIHKTRFAIDGLEFTIIGAEMHSVARVVSRTTTWPP